MKQEDTTLAKDWRTVLRREADGEADSFLFLLRTWAWDWAAYHRLFWAMRECCKQEDKETVERWIAEVFWRVSWYPLYDVQYKYGGDANPYTNALTNLDHLAHWFFTGEKREDTEFERIEQVSLAEASASSGKL